MHAFLRQRLERRRSRGLDRIRDGDDARRRAVDRDEDRGRAVLAQLFGPPVEPDRRNVQLGEERRIAEHHALALDHADRTLAGRRIEAGYRLEGNAARLGGRDDRGGERMFTRLLDARRVTQHGRRVETDERRDRDHLRLAFGERAGLVDHERVDLLHALERFGVPDQHARLRAAPDADHDRHRRREAERAGAGDDQHAHRGDEPVGEARLRPERRPGGERQKRDRDHQRHEPGRDLVGEALDRRARSLRGRDHLHDLRQHGVAADLLGAHQEAAGRIERAGDHLRAFFLGHRHRLARHHGFVERRAPLDDHAVDRHLVPRPHAQRAADRDLIEPDVFFGAVRPDTARGFWRKIDQRADRTRGLLARAQLEHLAEQHQHGDDGGGLEIDRDRAVLAKRRRENAGRQRGDHAVGVGDAGAHRDQREHVEIARDQRLRAAHEERPARPQHDRRREAELDPVRQRRIDEAVPADDVRAHLQHEYR